jgi:cell division protein FtsN
VLFGIGCLVVLGVTFALGVAAGRRWPNGLPGFGGSRAATVAAPAATAQSERDRRPEARGVVKTTADGPPVLTFYRELTAPLTPPPPPTRAVAKPETKTAETIKPTQRSAEPLKPVASDGAEPRFTVQVGAFTVRSQAEALRARLAAKGQEAYVTEGETGGVTQYRVRVGSFATREAAREAAARLATERQLATYVTTR